MEEDAAGIEILLRHAPVLFPYRSRFMRRLTISVDDELADTVEKARPRS